MSTATSTRLWRLAEMMPLWKLPNGSGERLYDHLNRERFDSILPGRVGTTNQVHIDVSRTRVRSFVSDGVFGELFGEWRPAPLFGFEGRRGWGELRVLGGGDGNVLLHEMIHAALDTLGMPNGHGQGFQHIAPDVGYKLQPDDLAAARAENGVEAPTQSCIRRVYA